MVGESLLHYEIVGKLGEGGMGKVYLARDTRLNRNVALKFLPDYITDDPKARERFRNEARAAASLNHPNITHIHTMEESEKGFFIVMEYVEGKELKTLIEEGTLSMEEKQRIAFEIAKGLLNAHRNEIVHRDVKSSNIMITEDGDVKVMDFGLARFTGSEHITRTGNTLGTAAYMAPEQILGREVDRRADIWSFGVVLYELLTGELPFKGEYEQAITYAILEEVPDPVTKAAEEEFGSLQAVVDRCLKKDPEERYGSFAEIIAELSDKENVFNRNESGAVAIGGITAGINKFYLYSSVLLIFLIAAVWFLYPYFLTGTAETDSGTETRRQTLAVRPFKNIGADQQATFTDGMAEILNTNLAQVEGFRAISQSAVEHYLDLYPLPEMVEELGLDYLIEGSVQLFEEQVRINIQLMNAETSEYVWTNAYERYLGDALILQKEIAEDILSRIKTELGQEEKITVQVDASSVKPEALKLYLQAVDMQRTRISENVNQSIELFKQSIAIDSTFSPAYARMAFSYILDTNFFDPNINENHLQQTRKLIEQALELTPNSSWAYLSLGLIEEFRFNWEGAGSALKKAIAFNPANDEAHHELAHYLMRLGRIEEALESEGRALSLVPSSPLYQSGLGEHYLFGGDFEKAIAELNKALNIDPEHTATYVWLTKAYLYNGDFQKALEALEKSSDSIDTVELAQIYGAMGQEKKARQLIEQVTNKAAVTMEDHYRLALAYAALGDKEKAIHRLEKAYEYRSTWLIYLMVDHGFEPLRDDPRYQKIERNVFGTYSRNSK